MSGAIERIFSEVAQFTKTMGSFHNDFLNIVKRDIDRFLEKSQDLASQMNWQGWTTIGLTSLSAGLAVAGTLIPTGGAPTTTDIRSEANGTNLLSGILEKLKDNDFLRSTCKTASKFFNGVSPAADVWFRSSTTELESARGLLERVDISDGQTKKGIFDQNAQLANSALSRLLESKAKGG